MQSDTSDTVKQNKYKNKKKSTLTSCSIATFEA